MVKVSNIECCRTNPCLNEGVCQEICDTHSTRFNCTCPDSYTGLRCEKIAYPRSCKDIAENGASESGIYGIFGSANKPFSVYCDLQSEPSFVWTLIQSFSFGENDVFIGKAFLYDHPINQDIEKRNWNLYRLSKPRTKALADRSTHLRKGAVQGERNFGNYHKFNPNHRCTSSSASPTQHWFGFKRNL
ncbi:uncharacterized protein LOC111342697 [Stylophora pistillata]|uniref:uncharacterized protein LOC111342697 n=1 Tax=Stylophora pistillata TaxID=50429 RepID=UPI000C04B29D|nr:uncharacterized protein LOC111342697 [Stylophora pistillata]